MSLHSGSFDHADDVPAAVAGMHVYDWGAEQQADVRDPGHVEHLLDLDVVVGLGRTPV